MTRVSEHNEYFIAHNGGDIVHHGYNEAGATIETGQPFLEVFENEAEYLARLIELNV